MVDKKKKITISIIVVILMVVLNYVCFKFVLSSNLDLVEVYVANRDIYPREEILASDIEIIEIPSAYLQKNVYDNKQDIIGKYTNIQGFIPKGSLFYNSMLNSKELLPDYPSLLLKENQIAYGIQTDIIKSSGNSFVVGQKVDIYVSLNLKGNITVADCLIKAARITGVKDRNGYVLSDEQSTKIPYVVTLAIDQPLVQYLEKANELGVINIYGISTDYQIDEESILNESSQLMDYLK